jgi:hypothetical protein
VLDCGHFSGDKPVPATTTPLSWIVLTFLMAASGGPQWASVYTSLAEDQCTTLETTELGSVQRCPGVAGYHLLALDDDARMSITVEDPQGGKHPLGLWSLVSSHFSFLGPTAEWRIDAKSKAPAALIVRFTVSDPETSKETSYLAVSKITPDGACLVDVIAPGKEANQQARESADRAAEMACRTAGA